MLDKSKLIATVERLIEDTDIFLVDLTVSQDNRIVVEIDSPNGIDIETCEKITHGILNEYDRDVEDYELEVGSAGLTSPFKVAGQYIKNLGNEVEVLTKDGRKIHGILVEFNSESSSFIVETAKKIKLPDKKRPELIADPLTFSNNDVMYVKLYLK